MSAKFFLDTNILVYTFDRSQPEKQLRSQNLVDQALRTQQGIISCQVVQEFLNVALRKFAVPFSTRDATVYLKEVLTPLCEVYPDEQLYQQALIIRETTGYSFYDSLILAAAKRSECDVIYTEDLQSGRCLDSLCIENPF